MPENSMRERREALSKDRDRIQLEELYECLEKADELLKQGKNEEFKMVINSYKKNLMCTMNHKKESEVSFDRNMLPESGECVGDTDLIKLFVINEKEKSEYMALSYEYAASKSAFKDEEYIKDLWNGFIGEQVFTCSVYDKKEHFIGYCSIKDLSKKEWEIAIELLPEWCHKGYGTAAILLFLKKLKEFTGVRFIRVRVDIDNYASQNLMKKIGAYPNGISEFLLHGKVLAKFQSENEKYIDDKITAVAKEFCMEPIDILGHVLEYRIDMEKLDKGD